MSAFRQLNLLVIITVLAAGSCLNLDSFLFKGRELDAYQFDAYSGAVKAECADALDSLGPIAPSQIHETSITSGGETIAMVMVGNKTVFDSTDTVVLYLHGTSLHMDYYWPRTRLLADIGYPVVTFDYRGYGKSTGKPTEAGIYEDGTAVLTYLREQCGNPNIVVYAYSLGSLVGCELARGTAAGPIIALVLEAPIGSIETMVQDAVYIDMPGAWITTISGNNVGKIGSVTVPLLWLHGSDDLTVPKETNGIPVYRHYRGAHGYYAIISNAGHRTVPSTIGYARYREAVGSFITGQASTNALLSTELP
jgi:pimeloyl-ACP methyl ester carboxylesterase